MDSSSLIHWVGTVPAEGVFGLFFLLPCFIDTPEFNANSVDTVQTSLSVASELCLHCLKMTFFMGR